MHAVCCPTRLGTGWQFHSLKPIGAISWQATRLKTSRDMQFKAHRGRRLATYRTPSDHKLKEISSLKPIGAVGLHRETWRLATYSTWNLVAALHVVTTIEVRWPTCQCPLNAPLINLPFCQGAWDSVCSFHCSKQLLCVGQVLLEGIS